MLKSIKPAEAPAKTRAPKTGQVLASRVLIEEHKNPFPRRRGFVFLC